MMRRSAQQARTPGNGVTVNGGDDRLGAKERRLKEPVQRRKELAHVVGPAGT
jgi:hypothetical protein